MHALAAKLHPRRFTAMSPKMAAIVGTIIGATYTEPRVAEIYATSDGFVFGRLEGDCGANEFLGPVATLDQNWRRLLDAAELTPAERAAADHAFASALHR